MLGKPEEGAPPKLVGPLLFYGPLAQLVEHDAGSVEVMGSIPICVHYRFYGTLAQLVEHLICIQDVKGSTPLRSTTLNYLLVKRCLKVRVFLRSHRLVA